MQRLASVLEKNDAFFKGPSGDFRPGYLLDYLLKNAQSLESGKLSVHINTLWTVVIDGLSGVWPPTRTMLDGVSLGDVWPSKALERINSSLLSKYPGSENLVCLHKLSQWLTYSLMEPLLLANIEFAGLENMTGLAEYRNGGLFVDYGVISLKPKILASIPSGQIPRFQVWDDVVVEWRALTVILLDKVADIIRQKLAMTPQELPLAKILEAGKFSFDCNNTQT